MMMMMLMEGCLNNLGGGKRKNGLGSRTGTTELAGLDWLDWVGWAWV